MSALQDMLAAGLAETGLQSSDPQLRHYLSLLARWNRSYNLVSGTAPDSWPSRHVLDSLSIRHLIDADRVMDVGTGAGLPGLVLAVTMPQVEWVLLDSNGKKTRFCEHVSRELGLDNVTVVQQRVEEYRSDTAFSMIVSRAYGATDLFARQAGRLCAEKGKLLAMKGQIDSREISKAEALGYNVDIHKLSVPFLDGARHAVILRR